MPVRDRLSGPKGEPREASPRLAEAKRGVPGGCRTDKKRPGAVQSSRRWPTSWVPPRSENPITRCPLARSSPQSFEKRRREREKQRKRDEKLDRRLLRNEEKRVAKETGNWVRGEGQSGPVDVFYGDEDTGA